MKSTSPVDDGILLDLEARQAWLQSACARFGDLDAYYALVAQKFVDCLIDLGFVFPRAHICIATADPERFSLVLMCFRCLQQAGFTVSIWTLAQFSDAFRGLTSSHLIFEQPKACDLLIDCIASLAHIGPSAAVQDMIAAAKNLETYTLAMECPSGIEAETGASQDQVLSAHMTFGLQAFLQGLWTGVARAHTGKLLKLKLLDDIISSSDASLLLLSDMQQLCPRRLAFAHKHDFATVVVVAGEPCMFGAALLAARAALVMGAGLVKILYPAEQQPLHGYCPELIWQPISAEQNVAAGIADNDIIVFGPGLGTGVWAHKVWTEVKMLQNTMVVDASAFSAMAADPQQKPNWIITPHPGEAGILLNCSSANIQEDRFAAIRHLQQRYQATVVLKGSGTMILGVGGNIKICSFGNAGMASPGMGDVLSGLIAGACAQGLASEHAATFAVGLHAYAADQVALQSMNGVVLASSVLTHIQHGGKIDAFYML